jgi:hypothetical protein
MRPQRERGREGRKEGRKERGKLVLRRINPGQSEKEEQEEGRVAWLNRESRAREKMRKTHGHVVLVYTE